jgi:hypothetical protein
MSPPPRYTRDQLATAVAAVLDEHITQAEAIRRAAAGTLHSGIPPFTLNKDAISRAVKRAELDRAQAAATNVSTARGNTFARQMLAALEPSNQAILAQIQAGKNVDNRLRERTRLIRELTALQAATQKRQNATHKTQDAQPPNPTNVDIAALIHNNTPRDTSPARSDALPEAPVHERTPATQSP